MQENKQTQWKKRIDVLNLIYKDIMSENSKDVNFDIIKYAFEELNFSYEQMKVIENYVENKDKYKMKLISLLKPTWPYSRVNNLSKSIIFCAMSEWNSIKTDKSIIIDQSIKTCKIRGVIKDKNFIHAAINKLLI